MRIQKTRPRLEHNPGDAVAKPGYLCRHSHIGFIGHDPRQWRRTVFHFLAQGLTREEQCFYLTTIHPPKMIATLLAQENTDVEKARARGQFVIKDAAQSHMPEGWFDPDHAIGQHEQRVGTARREGYSGLRIVTDMAWASYTPPGWERLEEYERRVGTELGPGHFLKMMCCYDDMMFDHEVISAAERTHAVVVGAQAGYRVGPLELSRLGAGTFALGPHRSGWPKKTARGLRPSIDSPPRQVCETDERKGG